MTSKHKTNPQERGENVLLQHLALGTPGLLETMEITEFPISPYFLQKQHRTARRTNKAHTNHTLRITCRLKMPPNSQQL